ncbi:MAG: ATPase, T2SS/T4P/T4SS family [Magnetovibrionaceae bacterium]
MVEGPHLKLTVQSLEGDRSSVVLLNGPHPFVLGRQMRRRNKSVHLPVNDPHASRKHCQIWYSGEGDWRLSDLNTTNGTVLNGKVVEGTMPLKSGDHILVGTTIIKSEYFDGPGDNDDDALLISSDLVVADAGDEESADEEDLTVAIPTSGANGTPAEEDETIAIRPDRDGDIGNPDFDEATTMALDDEGTLAIDEAATLAAEEGATVAIDETATLAVEEDATVAIDEAATLAVEEDATVAIDEAATLAVEEDATVAIDEAATLAIEEDATVATDDAAGAAEGEQATQPGPVEGADKPPISTPEAGVARPSASAGRPLRGRLDFTQASEHLGELAESLITSHLLTRDKAFELLMRARQEGETFFGLLLQDGEVPAKERIARFAAESLDLPFQDNAENVLSDAEQVSWLPQSISQRFGVVGLASTSDNEFRYATRNPYDLTAKDWLARRADGPLRPVVVPPEVMRTVLNNLKNKLDGEPGGEIGMAIDITEAQETRIRSDVSAVDIPQIVNFMLHRGYVEKASDIHVEPTEDNLLVRNRVDGILREDMTLPKQLQREIISRIKIMSGMDVAEKRRPQDGRIGVVIRSSPIDVRVSTYPTVYGEKIVMRLLDKNALRPTPETLGLLSRDLRLIRDKINAPYGLIMISGPTGSGKTTTLYSLLGSIDKDAKNVLTVEDPVEYRLKGVHQMQVNEKIKLTFASGLRTILRQDPDVIMVGECRDHETAGMSIQASLTGHIVFSTIHTNDAIGVITRLLDMNLDKFLVSSALSLTVAQRLVRCVCKHCQRPTEGHEILKQIRNDGISDERLKELNIEIDEDLVYMTGAGCVHCGNTGYLGRRAVFEVFEMTNDARALIMSDDFSSDALRKMAIEDGMVSLIHHGLHLVEEGATTHQEVLRVLGERQ